MDQCDNDMNTAQVQGDSIIPLSFHNPHCIALGPSCNIDIYSLCSLIEAQNVGGEHQHAMRLTVAVSYALVSFFKSFLFGLCDVTLMPVCARCSLGKAACKSATKAEENVECDSPMEVDTSSKKPSTGHVWPEDTILAIGTFAFLFDQLSQKPELADESIAEMRSKLKLESCEETGLDYLQSALSLRFQLGVVGLCLQRLPSPSLHHEVKIVSCCLKATIFSDNLSY